MHKPSRSLRIRAACLAFAALAAVPSVVWAQAAAPLEPQLDDKKAPPVWLGMLVMFILAAAVVVISLMPSKRGHQD